MKKKNPPTAPPKNTRIIKNNVTLCVHGDSDIHQPNQPPTLRGQYVSLG